MIWGGYLIELFQIEAVIKKKEDMKKLQLLTIALLFAMIGTDFVEAKGICGKGKIWRRGKCRRKRRKSTRDITPITTPTSTVVAIPTPTPTPVENIKDSDTTSQTPVSVKHDKTQNTGSVARVTQLEPISFKKANALADYYYKESIKKYSLIDAKIVSDAVFSAVLQATSGSFTHPLPPRPCLPRLQQQIPIDSVPPKPTTSPSLKKGDVVLIFFWGVFSKSRSKRPSRTTRGPPEH